MRALRLPNRRPRFWDDVIRYSGMQQSQEQPLHWDNHRTNLNLTLIFALIVAGLGALTANFVLFVIGLGVAIYSWLTNAKQYLIYRDALVIIYGRPRVKAYPFEEISHLEMLSLPMGERLRVRMVNGSRIMLLTKDTDTFRAKLDEALEAFHGEQRGTDYGRETQPELPQENPPQEQRMGESSTEDDDVPY